MRGIRFFSFLTAPALATALVACGGGGAKATPTPTLPPATATRVVVQQPTAAPAPSATAQVAGDNQYTVQAGDTLSSIAQQFGVTVQQIVDANAIEDQNLIVPGQTLKIPPK